MGEERFTAAGFTGVIDSRYRPADAAALAREVRRLVDPGAATRTIRDRNALAPAAISGGKLISGIVSVRNCLMSSCEATPSMISENAASISDA